MCIYVYFIIRLNFCWCEMRADNNKECFGVKLLQKVSFSSNQHEYTAGCHIYELNNLRNLDSFFSSE